MSYLRVNCELFYGFSSIAFSVQFMQIYNKLFSQQSCQQQQLVILQILYNSIMGSNWSNRIDPLYQSKNKGLSRCNGEICRKNFRFIKTILSTGYDNESILWLAENWNEKSQKFFVKQTQKAKIYHHRRIESLNNQLMILKNKGANKFIIQPMFAFQDYCSLYLVTEYIEGYTLQQVIHEHIFTQQEAKYHNLVYTSTKICINPVEPEQYYHTKAYWNAQSTFCFDYQLISLINPLPIDSYYPSYVQVPMNEYSAPEILAMDQVLAESDFYSLGLILYYLMKNKPAIPSQIKNNRMATLQQKILVVKSDLPQGWKPEAADFLVKLLIKNPELRLGRYGSFEIRNHPWLQNYTYSSSNNYSKINLTEPYFEKLHDGTKVNLQKNRERSSIDCSFQFQKLFQKYEHYSNFCEEDGLQYDSIQQQF